MDVSHVQKSNIMRSSNLQHIRLIVNMYVCSIRNTGNGRGLFTLMILSEDSCIVSVETFRTMYVVEFVRPRDSLRTRMNACREASREESGDEEVDFSDPCFGGNDRKVQGSLGTVFAGETARKDSSNSDTRRKIRISLRLAGRRCQWLQLFLDYLVSSVCKSSDGCRRMSSRRPGTGGGDRQRQITPTCWAQKRKSGKCKHPRFPKKQHLACTCLKRLCVFGGRRRDCRSDSLFVQSLLTFSLPGSFLQAVIIPFANPSCLFFLPLLKEKLNTTPSSAPTMAHRRTVSSRRIDMRSVSLDLPSTPFTPLGFALSSLASTTAAATHANKSRIYLLRTTFLALFALLAISVYVLFFVAAPPSAVSEPLSADAFRLAALRHKTKAHSESYGNHPQITLDPAQELAAVSSFIISLPQNVLPSFVDPSRPIDPQLVLDFDTRGPNAAEEVQAVVSDVWTRSPVVLYSKVRLIGIA